MSALQDDEASDILPLVNSKDCCAGCQQLLRAVQALHKSDQRQWRWIWFVTGGIALAGFIVGQSGILNRLAGP